MRPLLLPLAVFLCIFIAACTKKKDIPYGIPVSEYTKLTPGNYWIYETFEVDSNGNGAPGSQGGYGTFFDSVYVAKDTVIGNFTYHKLMQPDKGGSNNYIATYLRDSSNYEVSNFGWIFFAPYDDTSTFSSYFSTFLPTTSDSAFLAEKTTGDINKAITVPAGTFTTTAMVIKFTYYPYTASGKGRYYRHMYMRLAAGIGIVSQTLEFYFQLPNYTERRLLRYHVQ